MPIEGRLRERPAVAEETLPTSFADAGVDSLDAALSRHREDWQKGIRIPIADRLRVWSAICTDPPKAAELIYQDFLLRRACGEITDWDALVSRFPEYAARLHDFREADHLIKGAETSSGSSTARFGGYDLLEEVGRGGMGIVYRARERKLDRIVALKQVRAAALADDDAIQQCLKEAKAVSRLNHPNIVQIFRVSDSGDEPFIALAKDQLLLGASVDPRSRPAWLERSAPPSPERFSTHMSMGSCTAISSQRTFCFPVRQTIPSQR
jgi:hypothetical protein